MPIEEKIPEDEKDPEEKYEYIYDRRTIDRGLFEAFQDQGEIFRRFKNPQECAKDIQYHKDEAESAAESIKVIHSLANVRPHDMQKIAPQGYNLSIQYE